MRSIKLAPPLIAAALLVAVPAGVAAVGRHPGRGPGHPLAGDCKVSIAVTPRQLTAGEPVAISGQLTCGGGASVAGQTVGLFQRAPSGPGYTQVQSTATEADGAYAFPPLAGVDTESAWFVRADDARSQAVRVRVAAKVTLSGPADGSQLLTGPANAVTFTGTVNPTDAGYSVILQRENSATGGAWEAIGPTGQVGPEGAFSIVHIFRHLGQVGVRVVVVNRSHVNPHNGPSPSNVLEYEIARPPKH
jgi:hypothetical protein